MHGAGKILWSMRTDQGRVRDHNEDFIIFNEPTNSDEESRDGWLFILADGVGGTEAGEVASKYASERTLYHYTRNLDETDLGQRLIDAINSANEDLQQLIIERATGKRMATTMVATVIHEGASTIANVGDSRGYLWRSGVLQQVTKDQSLVAKLVEEGVITEEEARNHPRRNVILHSLGSENAPQIDLYHLEADTYELLVLCSDGLTRHVSDQEIEKIIGQEEPDEATAQMITLANDRGGEDNISVAVMRIADWRSPEGVRISHGTGAGSDAMTDSDGLSDRGEFWFQTATFMMIYVTIVLLIWIITSR